MKLSVLRVEGFEAPTLAELIEQVNIFLAAGGERTFVGLDYQIATGGQYTAIVRYTE